jgi:hypothetical protein
MAHPQSHGDHPDNDHHLGEFFEFEDYFAEPLPNSNDVPNLEPAPQPSSGAGLSDVTTPWEAYDGQESDFDIPPPDPDILRDFENPIFDPHMAPSQPIGTRNDLSRQQVELANPNNPSDEVQELDRQIKAIELQLRLDALKQKRQEVLQRSSIQPQTPHSNCFISQDNQNPGAFGGSMVLGTIPASHSGMTGDNGQTGNTFVRTLFQRVYHARLANSHFNHSPQNWHTQAATMRINLIGNLSTILALILLIRYILFLMTSLVQLRWTFYRSNPPIFRATMFLGHPIPTSPASHNLEYKIYRILPWTSPPCNQYRLCYHTVRVRIQPSRPLLHHYPIKGLVARALTKLTARDNDLLRHIRAKSYLLFASFRRIRECPNLILMYYHFAKALQSNATVRNLKRRIRRMLSMRAGLVYIVLLTKER